MTTIQVCRTCLAHDTHMYTIANTPLQLFYEKITNLTLETQDGRPSTVCYNCFHLLSKSHRFTESAVRANKVLQEIYKNGNRITQELLASLKQKHLIVCETPNTPVNAAAEASRDIVTTENIKIKIEQEEIAVDTTGCQEETNLLEYAPYFEIKKEEIEVEDTRIYLPQSSELNAGLLQSVSVKKENEAFKQETKGVPGRLEAQSPSNGNTPAENTPRKVTKEKKSKSNLRVKCKDDRNKSLVTKKSLGDSHCTTSNDIPENVKNPLNPSNEPVIEQNGDNTICKQKFVCEYCGKKIADKKRFIAHIKMHQGKEPFTCNYCGKHFTGKYEFTRHVHGHAGVKPFTCHYCQTKFTLRSNLNKHIKIHTGEKPFTCNYCGKKLTSKSNLTEHVRIHTGEKPFTCKFCGKKFTAKSVLTRHEKLHTSKNVLTCNHCGKNFTDKRAFTKHVKIHTEKPVSQKKCNIKIKNQAKSSLTGVSYSHVIIMNQNLQQILLLPSM